MGRPKGSKGKQVKPHRGSAQCNLCGVTHSATIHEQHHHASGGDTILYGKKGQRKMSF